MHLLGAALFSPWFSSPFFISVAIAGTVIQFATFPSTHNPAQLHFGFGLIILLSFIQSTRQLSTQRTTAAYTLDDEGAHLKAFGRDSIMSWGKFRKV